jgi:hypothetical protein
MKNDTTNGKLGIGEKQKTERENPFDPARLRLTQNFSEIAGVKKVLTTVPVRKPTRQDFIRTHPDDSYWLETAVLEWKEDREVYLVEPDIWHELAGDIVPKVIITTINRQGDISLWLIRLPGEDGRLDDWNQSALEGANLARKVWVKVASKMSFGAYEVYEAVGDIPDPEWPDITFPKILEIAFRERFIKDMDHPIIRRLRGES